MNGREAYVHVCHDCRKESATWSSAELPRKWRALDANRVVCQRCARKRAGAKGR